jgi:hypothetical protein
MHKLPAPAKIALKARRVVMGKYPTTDGETVILRLPHRTRHFVAQNVRKLAIHVPGHELART